MGIKSVNNGPSLPLQAAELIENAATTHDAEVGLAQLLRESPLKSGFVAPNNAAEPAPIATLPQNLAAEAQGESQILERRLQQSVRALRREARGRASPDAIRVLGNDALRSLIEVAGWRRLGELSSKLATGSGPAVLKTRAHRANADAQALYAALTSTAPDRHAKIAALALAGAESTKAKSRGRASHLSETEANALVDILSSTDPHYGALVKERLARGASIESVRSMLVERLLPVSPHAEAGPAASERKEVAGLTFDLSTNTWAPKDRSWAYPVKLGQLFDYQIDGVMDGREELKARLIAAATDPTSGEVKPGAELIGKFVDNLKKAAKTHDPEVDRLLTQGLEMIFSTTDGGDTPVGAIWELPKRAMADLFAAMSDPALVERVGTMAADADRAAADQDKALREKLGDLLVNYPGVPRRHKRAHGALINIGLAGQSLEEIAKDGGVLPRSKTLLTPERLRTEFKDAEHLKVRFLFNRAFECLIVTDELFNQVSKDYHFPPNHELVSYDSEIAGSGYLTFDHGKIVGLEDDIQMLPGKLPAGLPPAKLVLARLGFALDEQAITNSSTVLAWEVFAAFAKGDPPPALPKPPSGDIEQIREALRQSEHAARPGLVAALIDQRLKEERTKGPEDVARQKTAEWAGEVLNEVRIIDVGAKVFRSGDLPADKNEFDDLVVDQKLAPFLVRKVAQRVAR